MQSPFASTTCQHSQGACDVQMPEPSVGELTAEELANVNLFRANSPCVVNISNIALARDAFTMDILRIPQVNPDAWCGWHGEWSKVGT
jgi:hypothetical protein